MYTTIAKVREVSGFDDSTKIGDEVVLGKIEVAESKVNAALGIRYALPLLYHRSNTLTFSGTGTGSGTMAVVVNGTTYNVAITNLMTAVQAADAFRLAAIDSTDFITDSMGQAEVLLISQTDSSALATANAEVDITSAPTTQGIATAIGTRADRHVPVVEDVTAQIAAALLLIDNYGVEAQDTPKDGHLRMREAMKILAQLQGAECDDTCGILGLYDEVDGVELSTSSQAEPEFLPNDTTDVDEDDPTSPKTGINDIW